MENRSRHNLVIEMIRTVITIECVKVSHFITLLYIDVVSMLLTREFLIDWT